MPRPTWLNARRLGLRKNVLLCNVDAPLPGQGYAVWLDIEGWALSLDGCPVDVIISVDGQRMAQIAPAIERPDVAPNFPRLPRSRDCGFRSRLLRAELPDRGASLLEVRVDRKSGWRRQQSLTIRTAVFRHPEPTPVHDRIDYGKVWNQHSETLEAARGVIAGSFDAAEFTRTGEVTAEDTALETDISTTDIVLEIGCGAGRIGQTLAPRCREWIGADVAPRMLEHARTALAHHPNVSFRLLNGFDLAGIEDASVDVVYSTAVFMHLDEWDRYRYVREAYRVLRPGGPIWFDNVSLLTDEYWAIFEQLCTLDPGARPPHISKASTPEELTAYATRAGFRDVRVRLGSIFVSVFGLKSLAA